jgi:CheY-like chemotaxis protein
LDQVIVNLAVNARDAMPRGGSLSIETANVVLDETYAAHHMEVEPGEYVMLSISDTGLGMNDNVLEHLFEPFFTTKERGKGTGLGLATVYGIVKQNDGYIWVYSELGKGTTFRIYLPRVQGTGSDSPPAVGHVGTTRGTEVVLVVEDDHTVRKMAEEILVRQGYQVLTAGGGLEAIKVSQGHKGSIDLLLTDVILPQMNGRDLARRVHSIKPGLRVLYMSGYSGSVISDKGILEEGDVFLSKPFTMETLTHKVRMVLDA